MSRPLTPKQKAFVAEYLVDLNATKAAVRAGYSQKTANEQGARLLAKVSVAEAIQKGQEKRAAKVARSALEVLRDIQEITRLAKDGGDFKTALKGLELEARHLGMFTERVEHLGGLDLVVRLPEFDQ